MSFFDMSEIPGYEDITAIEPVYRGGSGEGKYRLTMGDEEYVFLRIGELVKDGVNAFDVSRRAEKLGIPMARTLLVGMFSDGEHYYWLQTWLDGECAADVLPSLDDAGQYALGVKAGKLLQTLHTLPAPENAEPLYDWFGALVRNIADDVRAKAPSELADKVAAYALDNLEILRDRTQTFQHGDFGLANLLVLPDGELAVTDFSALLWRDYGDPWFELENTFYYGTTALYLSGLIGGYFNGAVPEDFWRTYLFYEAHTALRILLYEPEQSERVQQWFDERIENAVRAVPAWYIVLT